MVHASIINFLSPLFTQADEKCASISVNGMIKRTNERRIAVEKANLMIPMSFITRKIKFHQSLAVFRVERQLSHFHQRENPNDLSSVTLEYKKILKSSPIYLIKL